MSPEEFDNKLKASFQEEFLPPKDHLWQNINQRLDQSVQKPIWHWLVPVVAVLLTGIAWLGISNYGTETTAIANVSSADTAVSTPIGSTAATGVNEANSSSNSETTVSNDHGTSSSPVPSSSSVNDPSDVTVSSSDNVSSSDKATKNTTKVTADKIAAEKSGGKQRTGQPNNNASLDNSSEASGKNSSGVEKETAVKTDNNTAEKNTTGKSGSKSNGSNTASGNGNDLTSTSGSGAGNKNKNVTGNKGTEETTYTLRSPKLSHLILGLESESNGPVDLLDPSNSKSLKSPKSPRGPVGSYRYNFDNEELVSKRWLSFGIGPQLSMNSIKVKGDSLAYIHKELWANKSKMTHNGGGMNAFAMFNYKPGKRFSFETGLSYSMRNEDIKFNESSLDVKFIDSFNKILFYQHIKLRITAKFPNGDSVTNIADGYSSFSMAVKNKYQVFTIPFNFRSEHKLTENTFLSAGLGGGISMIYSKSSTHYNMVREYELTKKKSTQFSASLNASLALYTNFNDVGQIGIYTGYQMYLQPWKAMQNQYNVKMSDLQFGLIFRKPLNL